MAKQDSSGNVRLGGPPGLFDGPNLDRESEGGIVQRIRVPDSPEAEIPFYPGRFQANSLNDSDGLDGEPGDDTEPAPAPTADELQEGCAFRKPIIGRRY